MRKRYALPLLVIMLLIGAQSAQAHVSVKPGEVGIAQRLNFLVSVPTEEADPTVQVRLVVPEGVTSVRPNAKAGWNIELKKTGEGDSLRVSEIIWSGGKIPAEQRDEFVFSAQAPSEEQTLVWKAYQTYGDGDIVAWDADPKIVAEYAKNNPPKEGEEDDHNAPRPWSETKVIDDLKVSAQADAAKAEAAKTKRDPLTLVLSIAGIVLAGAALFRSKQKPV